VKIKQKFEDVSGEFDTDKMPMLCVQSHKYKDVDLCFKDGLNYPIAEIKLFNRDSFQDKDAVYEDAVKLCEEIARRWNLHLTTLKGDSE